MTRKEYIEARKKIEGNKSTGLIRLLDYLWEHERVTKKDVIIDLGMLNVGEGVRKLRATYHVPVETEMVAGENRFGEPSRYGEYYIQRRRR